MIVKHKGRHYATSSSGRRLSKKGKSKADAIKQLYAVELSKAKKKGRMKTSKGQRRKAGAALKHYLEKVA
jgi:hypothetical protein